MVLWHFMRKMYGIMCCNSHALFCGLGSFFLQGDEASPWLAKSKDGQETEKDLDY